ncbi:MAG: tetratricopeptide repeat protein [Clostridiales bacterium]|nr:tetratricopeptide repeat protein [Clostridiales bacterium]
MKFFKEHPRRSMILGTYLAVFLLTWRFGVGIPATVLCLLAVSLVYMAVFHADCAAVMANYHHIKGNTASAEKLYKFALARKTKSPQAHINYAIMLIRRGEAKEALPLLERAYALCAKPLMLKNLLLTKASCNWALGDIDEAIAILEKMRKDYEYVNDRVLSTLAFMYLKKGELDKADALSRKAIEDTPSAHAAWDNLGQIEYLRGDFSKAKEMFNKALEFKADLPDSLYYLGVIAKAENETARASEYFNQALACEITALNTVTREQIEGEDSSLRSE